MAVSATIISTGASAFVRAGRRAPTTDLFRDATFRKLTFPPFLPDPNIVAPRYDRFSKLRSRRIGDGQQ
jgi:hypothetical protein